MSSILQALVNGVVTGAILILPTLAFSLIYSTFGFPNTALAGFAVIGAYVGYIGNTSFGLPYPVASLVAGLLIAPVGALLGRIVFRQFYGGDTLAPMVASVGVFLVLENLARLVWGNGMRGFETPLHRPWRLGAIRVNPDQLSTLAVAGGLTALCFVFLKFTLLGRQIRAVSDDQVLSGVRGIDTPWVLTAVWLLACGLASASGVLVAADTVITPLLGWTIALPMFAGALLGGIGSPVGAMFGALTMGVVSELSAVLLPPTYKSAVAFAVMVLLLLFRPQGLFRVKL